MIMSELKDIQTQFFNSVFSKDSEIFSQISSNNADERFKVYKDTIFINLVEGLAGLYPGVWELLGGECADNAAYRFLHEFKNLPNSGCLYDWGSNFPEFLGSLTELRSLPYIKDYAEYELVKREAYISTLAESTASIETLMEVTSSEKESDIELELIPSLRLFSSKHPIDEIEEVVGGAGAGVVGLDKHYRYGIICKKRGNVISYWVSKELWDFTYILKNSKKNNLEKAAENTQTSSETSIATALSFLFGNNLVHKIHKN
jgi:hypothetical protein